MAGLPPDAVLAVALAFCRFLGVLLLLPLLGGPLVPTAAKVGLAVALAAVLAPGLAPVGALSALPLTALLALGVKELVVGLALGFLASLPFYAARMAGAVIDVGRGQGVLAAAAGAGPRPGPTGTLLVLLLVVSYLAVGGHHLMIAALARSFAAIPLDAGPTALHDGATWVWQLVALTGELFAIALALGLPVLLVGLLVDLLLGAVARTAPRLHATFLALPAKALLGLLVLLIGLTAILDVLISGLGRAVDSIQQVGH